MLKETKKTKIFYLVMTLVVAVVIFLFSNISTPVGEKTGLNLATLYHLGVFFMFTFFLTLFLKLGRINMKIILISFLVSLVYAISDEFHQLFVIGRFCSLKDVLVDLVGSTSAILVIKTLDLYRKI